MRPRDFVVLLGGARKVIGATSLNTEVMAKRIELLHELANLWTRLHDCGRAGKLEKASRATLKGFQAMQLIPQKALNFGRLFRDQCSGVKGWLGGVGLGGT
jgi:hypothetical protein